ncbi:MAG: hypothetical protein U0744_21395 [Gemmataceae bacterium]
MHDRRGLLTQLDEQMRNMESRERIDPFDLTRNAERSRCSSSEVRSAFDLSNEPETLRARYGKTLFGNLALIRRRLVIVPLSDSSM